MTEIEINELLYRAVSMSEFFAGLIAGMCLVGLPLVFFWPRKNKAADQSQATQTSASPSGQIATPDTIAVLTRHQEASPLNSERAPGFLPARPHASAG